MNKFRDKFNKIQELFLAMEDYIDSFGVKSHATIYIKQLPSLVKDIKQYVANNGEKMSRTLKNEFESLSQEIQEYYDVQIAELSDSEPESK